MNKIFPILFLLIWIIQSIGSLICFEIQKSTNRKQVEQKIKTEQIKHIQHFIFTKNEKINWELNSKEFKRNGKLYDVLTLKKEKGITSISCIADAVEDAIVLNFQKSKEGQKNKKENENYKKIKLITPLLTDDAPIFSIVYSEKILVHFKNTNYINPFQSVHSPPPIFLV